MNKSWSYYIDTSKSTLHGLLTDLHFNVFETFFMFFSDIERIHNSSRVRGGSSNKPIFCGGNMLNHLLDTSCTNIKRWRVLICSPIFSSYLFFSYHITYHISHLFHFCSYLSFEVWVERVSNVDEFLLRDKKFV